jgi:hypothetical protein
MEPGGPAPESFAGKCLSAVLVEYRCTNGRQVPWNKWAADPVWDRRSHPGVLAMHGIIYLVGLIVIVMAILSFVGLN